MHPINKTNFGAKAGKLAVTFYNGSSVITGWVLAQVGTLRYKVTDGTNVVIATLCQNANDLTALLSGTGPNAANQGSLCTIQLTPYGGSVEHVSKLNSVTAVTLEGSHVTWALGVTATAAGAGTIGLVVDSAPTVANAIPNQTATVAAAWSYVVPANTFADLNGDTLTLSATLGNGSALPGYIVFTPSTSTFSKAAAAGSAGTIALKVIASDGTLTGSSTFNLTLS